MPPHNPITLEYLNEYKFLLHKLNGNNIINTINDCINKRDLNIFNNILLLSLFIVLFSILNNINASRIKSDTNETYNTQIPNEYKNNIKSINFANFSPNVTRFFIY